MMDRRSFLLSPLAVALAAAERRPNLVLLVAKTWRAQATPWAGDVDLVAPNLEKLGRESMVFPRAYSCYPRTTPALSAIATGRFPHTTGVIKEGSPLPPGEVTIDEVMKSAGYKSASLPSAKVIEFLETNHDGPFFLNVDLAVGGYAGDGNPNRFHPRENVPSDLEMRERESFVPQYGLYVILDREIAKLTDALDRLGLNSNTILVFTSDHGKQMGSQGLDGDDVAFEESVRIPLAMRYPGVLAAGASDLLVSQVDLMPTLVALCGEPVPEGVQGHDLSGVLTGKKSDRPESVYAEGKIGQKDEWRMLVRGFDKIVVNSQTEVTHLYNLAEDPYELTNLAHDPEERLKRDSLLAVLRATSRGLGDFKKRP
jgi:arylsulfatase A-like enzyme